MTSQLMMRREMVRSLLWKNHPGRKDRQNFHVSFAGPIFLPQGASYHVDIGSVFHASKDGQIVCPLGERSQHALFAKPFSPGSARWTRLARQIRRYTRRPFLAELQLAFSYLQMKATTFLDHRLPKGPASSATAVSPKTFYRAARSAGHSGCTATALILHCFRGRAYIAEICGGCTSAIASWRSGNSVVLNAWFLVSVCCRILLG